MVLQTSIPELVPAPLERQESSLAMVLSFGQFFYGGVRVGAALGPVNQTGNTSVAQNFLIAAAGPGGGPQVSIFNGNLNLVDAFFAFPQNFTGGVLASTTVNR